jgi:hypothetical protein
VSDMRKMLDAPRTPASGRELGRASVASLI